MLKSVRQYVLSRSLDDTLRFHDANNLNLKYDSILKFDLNLKYPSETAIPEFEKRALSQNTECFIVQQLQGVLFDVPW